MKRYSTFTAKDLDFNVEEQLKKLIHWEIWDKFVKDSLSNIKANPVQIDTLCDYIRMLLPSTVKVEIERTFFGCTLNMDDNNIHVIITPENITIKSFEQLPTFIRNIFQSGKCVKSEECDYEYHFELPEVLKDEHRDSV